MHARLHDGNGEPERGGDVAAVRIEQRQDVIQRELSPAFLPAAEFVVGSVRHDAVEPGPEGRLAAEGIDLSDHGAQGVLHDLLRVLIVPRDAAGQAIRTLTIPRDETLRRHRLAKPERFQKVEIAVCAAPVSDAIGLANLAFEHHLKIHFASSLSSANVGVESVVAEGTVVGRDDSTRRQSGREYSLLWSGAYIP